MLVRLPRGPIVNFAPRGPNESDAPDLLMFSVTPGAILTLRQNRNAMIAISSRSRDTFDPGAWRSVSRRLGRTHAAWDPSSIGRGSARAVKGDGGKPRDEMPGGRRAGRLVGRSILRPSVGGPWGKRSRATRAMDFGSRVSWKATRGACRQAYASIWPESRSRTVGTATMHGAGRQWDMLLTPADCDATFDSVSASRTPHTRAIAESGGRSLFSSVDASCAYSAAPGGSAADGHPCGISPVLLCNAASEVLGSPSRRKRGANAYFKKGVYCPGRGSVSAFLRA